MQDSLPVITEALYLCRFDDNDKWKIEKIIDGSFSEGDMIDIYGDGEQEIALISPSR